MDKFLADASTSYWWITAVLLSLVLNIASSYLKTPLDKLFSATSGWWRTRSEKAKEERRAHVQKLALDPTLWPGLREMARDLRILAIWSAVRAGIMLLMMILGFEAINYNPAITAQPRTAWVVDVLSVVAMVLFFWLLTAAQSMSGKADEQIRRLRDAMDIADLL